MPGVECGVLRELDLEGADLGVEDLDLGLLLGLLLGLGLGLVGERVTRWCWMASRNNSPSK